MLREIVRANGSTVLLGLSDALEAVEVLMPSDSPDEDQARAALAEALVAFVRWLPRATAEPNTQDGQRAIAKRVLAAGVALGVWSPDSAAVAVECTAEEMRRAASECGDFVQAPGAPQTSRAPARPETPPTNETPQDEAPANEQ